MKRKFMEVAMEMNGRLLGDAAFVKLGQEAIKILTKPAKGNIPEELLPLVESPFGQLLTAFGIVYVSQEYNIPGLDSVARAVTAAATNDSVNALIDMGQKCLTREGEVLKTVPSAVPANTSKGDAKVVDSTTGFLAVEKKVQEIKQNTTTGGENEADLTGQDEDNTPYWPTSKEELVLDDKNLCICPNPIEGKEAHSRQRDKFKPYNSKTLNGYRDDLDGLFFCGGCHNDLTVQYGKDKAKLAEEKKLTEAQAKIDVLTEEFDALGEKIIGAKNSEATYIKLLSENAGNEDYAEALKNVQEKIKKFTERYESIQKQVKELDDLLDKATDGNKKSTPPIVQNVTEGSTTQANAKLASGAAERIKNNGKNKKHGK